MKQLDTEIQRIQDTRKEKDRRLEEIKRLEKAINTRISEATTPAEVEEAKKDKAHLQAEQTALINDIRSDLASLEQLKHSLRDYKEQDLKLASQAESITDRGLSLLDLQRLSIHTTRKSKQYLILSGSAAKRRGCFQYEFNFTEMVE